MLGVGMEKLDPGMTVSSRPTLVGFGLIAIGCLVTMYGFLAKGLGWPTYVPGQAIVMLGTFCIVFGLLKAKTKLYRLPVNNQAFDKAFRVQKIIGWALLLTFVMIPTAISLPKGNVLSHMSALQIAPWAAAYFGVFFFAGRAWSQRRESLLDQYAKPIPLGLNDDIYRAASPCIAAKSSESKPQAWRTVSDVSTSRLNIASVLKRREPLAVWAVEGRAD